MTVFNGERFLAEAFDSILGQSFRDFEFIVINDGSTDGSDSIVDSYRKKDSRLRVFHQGNRGLVESLNRGCSIAQGTYIARMDADDIAVRDRLLWQVDFMERNPQVAVLGGAVEFIDASGRALGISRYPTEDREIKSALGESCAMWHPTVFMRKDVFLAIGGYRASFPDAEDYDLWLRIAERSKLANLEAVVLKYRLHPSQVSQRKLEQQAFSHLAAQVSAGSRRNGNPDPFISVREITPAVLSALGVSEVARQRARIRGYRRRIYSMSLVGERSAVMNLSMELLRSCPLKYIERRAIADARLAVAEFHWSQNRYLHSLLAASHAAITRPMILGRPPRMLWRWLRKALIAGADRYRRLAIGLGFRKKHALSHIEDSE